MDSCAEEVPSLSMDGRTARNCGSSVSWFISAVAVVAFISSSSFIAGLILRNQQSQALRQHGLRLRIGRRLGQEFFLEIDRVMQPCRLRLPTATAAGMSKRYKRWRLSFPGMTPCPAFRSCRLSLNSFYLLFFRKLSCISLHVFPGNMAYSGPAPQEAMQALLRPGLASVPCGRWIAGRYFSRLSPPLFHK